MQNEVNDAGQFRQKLYHNFEESGLLHKLKTELRISLLQKLQKPYSSVESSLFPDSHKPFHLRDKFLSCVICEYLKSTNKEYSLSILMPQCQLETQDCLSYNQLAEITNLGTYNQSSVSFLEQLLSQWMKFKNNQLQEKSSQTDFDEPMSKKLERIQKQYLPKIDYWKLMPNNTVKLPPSLYEHEQKLKAQFQLEKKSLRNKIQLELKEQLQRKYENRHDFRMKQAQKDQQTRLNELKLRQKQTLESLQKKKQSLEQNCKQIKDKQLQMINNYQRKITQLQRQYKQKNSILQKKQKQFWRKQLQLKGKKKQYQDSIKLVKQKIINHVSE